MQDTTLTSGTDAGADGNCHISTENNDRGFTVADDKSTKMRPLVAPLIHSSQPPPPKGK